MSGPQFRFGLAIAAATLAADQASKLWVLYGLKLGPGVGLALAPFLDIVLTYNRGISYGLIPQDSEFGRGLLIIVALAASALFGLWLRRTGSRLIAAALGLLIGGALGNAIDRALHGAVVDFISLHAMGWRWYVFNLADSAIVAGVVGLLYDAAFRATKTPPSG